MFSFSKSLSDDVVRRDFTMNAIAYDFSSGFCDLVDGIKDIENKIETKDLEDGKEITITLTNNSEHKAKIPQANIWFFKDKIAIPS